MADPTAGFLARNTPAPPPPPTPQLGTQPALDILPEWKWFPSQGDKDIFGTIRRVNPTESQDKFGEAVVETGQLTAQLALIARLIPHPAIRVVAGFFAGVKGASEINKAHPSIGMAGNLAPVPAGYVKPDVYGLKPNWWLPNGVVKWLPLETELIGWGFPEQRIADDNRISNEVLRQLLSRQKNAADYAARQSFPDLRSIAGGEAPGFPVSIGIGQDVPTKEQFVAAAQAELDRRAKEGIVEYRREPRWYDLRAHPIGTLLTDTLGHIHPPRIPDVEPQPPAPLEASAAGSLNALGAKLTIGIQLILKAAKLNTDP